MTHNAYTLRLLGMVLEAYPRGVEVYGPQGSSGEGWNISAYPNDGRRPIEVVRPTLAGALAVLLASVEVAEDGETGGMGGAGSPVGAPDRLSPERIAEWRRDVAETSVFSWGAEKIRQEYLALLDQADEVERLREALEDIGTAGVFDGTYCALRARDALAPPETAA